MWERKDLLFSAFSAKCSTKCPQLDSTNILVIDIILDPLIFFPFSWGGENLSAAGRQNECLSADGWFSWKYWRNHQVHKHLKSLFYLYSNTMALMQSEASVHWGWDLGTSVLSTFQA